MSEFTFYGLLHIAPSVAQPTNLRAAGDPIDVYLLCASLCARSFAAQGYRYRLVTNEPERLVARLGALAVPDIDVVEYHFRWKIPKEIGFYSAHLKLELFEAFGAGLFGDHVALVDIDTVLLRCFDERLFATPGLIGYDITSSQIDDYGAPVIAKAVSTLTDISAPPCWWGGEFLMGHATDFALLSAYVAKVWPRYLVTWHEAHHQGDEALLSAAIALMSQDGIAVTDAGELGAVHRWWSARTLSRRPALTSALKTTLLHLPSDKDFLSHWSKMKSPSIEGFVCAYRKVALRKALLRFFVSATRRLLGEAPRKYPPRVW